MPPDGAKCPLEGRILHARELRSGYHSTGVWGDPAGEEQAKLPQKNTKSGATIY